MPSPRRQGDLPPPSPGRSRGHLRPATAGAARAKRGELEVRVSHPKMPSCIRAKPFGARPAFGMGLAELFKAGKLGSRSDGFQATCHFVITELREVQLSKLSEVKGGIERDPRITLVQQSENVRIK